MKKFNLLPLIVCFCCFFFAARGQEYSYKHYEIKDGLVGNNVYQTVEDKEGFLWFATETGVSRFDGTSFKNFTTAEGLPDNEILKLFVDSKGRVWMMPFKSAICYYYHGKMYNTKNDSVLARLPIKSNVLQMFEDTAHNLFFMEQGRMNVLLKNGNVISTDDEQEHIYYCYGGGLNSKLQPVVFLQFQPPSSLYSISFVKDKLAFERVSDSIAFFGSKFSQSCVTKQVYVYLNNYKNITALNSIIFDNQLSNHSDTINLPTDYNLMSFLNDSILFFNTNHGALKYNYHTKLYTDHFLENEQVSCTLKDHEFNLWFTTLGNGIYRLYSEENKNILFVQNNVRNSIESILATDSSIYAGSGNSYIYKLSKKDNKSITNYLVRSYGTIKKVIKIMKYAGGFYILGENSIYRTDHGFTRFDEIPIKDLKTTWSFKDMGVINDERFYLATHIRTMCYLPQENRIEDVAEIRSTAICLVDSGVYIGTLKGLLFVDWQNKTTNFADKFPLLSNRITKLLFSKNKIWVGTNDEGVICFNGSKIEKSITVKNGLTGNLVRALYADSNFLWVGTDRGLNKISLLDTSYRVLQKYTTSDGIASNMINAVYAENDTVYIGTPKGLNFFNEQKIKSNSICDLKILGITVSGKSIQFDSSSLVLKNRDNNIRFDFVAISYKSEGNILYYYKLSEIDSAWETTTENFLHYPTLPSGNYEMQLYAVNKFGVKSKMVTINFEIEKKLIEQNWFIILIIFFAIFIAWLLANSQIRRIKNAQKAKTVNAEKIAQLEQQALKAQMNPHFIFNCLNSIQQYVIDKDIQGANKFISGFSKLIRQTLDNSGKQNISVAEEESFLRSYLELEKSRFEDKFEYAITIDQNINKDEDCLPPMLLQPYIENCIRHGIMHKNDGQGLIDIRFNLTDGKLVCSVTDNGVGRSAASAFKSMQHINYQSKGTELTGQRIMMINKNNTADIILKTEDLFNTNGEPCGTKVTVVIPLVKADY
ncbi:MAG: histidine kinase [Ferruginibacter sp.]